jgi:hypothetical protein
MAASDHRSSLGKLTPASVKKSSIRTDQPTDLVLVTNDRLARYFREAGRRATSGTEVLPPTPDDVRRMSSPAPCSAAWAGLACRPRKRETYAPVFPKLLTRLLHL